MVLRDDTINQQLLIPINLKEIIPEDHPCYFIENVANRIDCSELNKQFEGNPGESAYPRQMLLRVTLLSIFEGGMSGRELEARIQTDVAYMYLAGMQKPYYRTLARFKKENKELLDEAFELSVKIAKEEGLVKLFKIAVDGTKIKAKASLNNITDKKLIQVLKKAIKESIEQDEEEDLLYGEETGNTVPKSLIDKESFNQIYEQIKEETKDDKKNKGKLRSTSKKLLKLASESKEEAQKVLNKLDYLEEKANGKADDEIISISDPEATLMLNKQNRWELGYNLNVATDSEKGIIISAGLSQNPSDHHELIPQIEGVEEIFGPLPENTKVLADNGYLTDANTDYLEFKGYDGYISTRQMSREFKKKENNPFSKYNFDYFPQINTYACPNGLILDKQSVFYDKNNKPRIVYWTNNCKYCPDREKCCGKSRYRVISDYGVPSHIRMLHKMDEDWAKEIYKERSAFNELQFAHIKYNNGFNEFKTIGLERCESEIKEYATGRNLKIIYNELEKRKREKENT